MFDCFDFFDPCRDNCLHDRCDRHDDHHHRCPKHPDNHHDRCPHHDDGSRNHVHEYLGSTHFSEFGFERHNHRFAGVTGPAISSGRSHIHEFFNRTDTTDRHFHNMRDFTGSAVFLENGRHIHFGEGNTTFNDGHLHRFDFATLIEDPTRR